LVEVDVGSVDDEVAVAVELPLSAEAAATAPVAMVVPPELYADGTAAAADVGVELNVNVVWIVTSSAAKPADVALPAEAGPLGEGVTVIVLAA
jgi:hypothetical protein